MKSRKVFAVALFTAVLAIGLVASMAYGDEFDQAMKLTFGQPTAIPEKVLPAGTYWFVRPSHGAEPNVLQVFDSERKHVIATVHTGTEQIVKPHGHIVLSFADRSPKEPQALLNLVYPGRTDGHLFELSYPEQLRKQLSEFPKITMKVNKDGIMETSTESDASL